MSFRTISRLLFRKLVLTRNRFFYRLFRGFLICFDPMNVKYRQWIRKYDQINNKGRIGSQESLKDIKNPPRFSVLMPVYNPAPQLLDKAIQSVRNQDYPYWELCIADDASTNPGVHDVILGHAKEDDRIKIIFRKENGHISAASNSALELAKGDFIAFLDHDDLLHPSALSLAAKLLKEYPDSELIYFDEDKITEHGHRFNPYFKPDFDYELVLRQNFVSHCGIYRLGTVRNLGGFRLGMEGSQDHDLLLRVLEKIEPRQIHHIPRVLYHWRTSGKSAAEDIVLKPYAFIAGERAVQEHLQRRGVAARVSFDPMTVAYRIVYEMAGPCPVVEVILLSPNDVIDINVIKTMMAKANYDQLQVTLGLPSVKAVADYKALLKDPRISFGLLDKKDGIGNLCNRIIEKTEADFVCIIHESIREFSESWLEQLMSQAVQAGIGAVGPKLLSSKGRVYSNGLVFVEDDVACHLFSGLSPDDLGYFKWAQIQREFSAISGECLLFKRKDFLSVGGLTPELSNFEYSWIDFCLKLKNQGLRNIVCPSVRLKLRKTINREAVNESGVEKAYLFEKWGNWLTHDPAFNPNLVVKNGLVKFHPEPSRENDIS